MGQIKVSDEIDNGNNDERKNAMQLINTVNFTVDPKLDTVASENTLSHKAVRAIKIFSNYREDQR